MLSFRNFIFSYFHAFFSLQDGKIFPCANKELSLHTFWSFFFSCVEGGGGEFETFFSGSMKRKVSLTRQENIQFSNFSHQVLLLARNGNFSSFSLSCINFRSTEEVYVKLRFQFFFFVYLIQPGFACTSSTLGVCRAIFTCQEFSM